MINGSRLMVLASFFSFAFIGNSHALQLNPIQLSKGVTGWLIQGLKQVPGQKRVLFLTQYEVKSEQGNLLRANKLYSVNLDGTDLREILSEREEAYFTYESEVVISPDGHHVAFPVYPSTKSSPAQVVICNPYGENLHIVDLTSAYSVYSLQFDSQSRNLYFKTEQAIYEEGEFASNLRYGTLYKLELDFLSATPISVPVENRRAGELGVNNFKVEDRRIIYQTSGVRDLSQLFSMNLDGSQVHAISAMESGSGFRWESRSGGGAVLFSKGERDLYIANSQENGGSALTEGLIVDGFKMAKEGTMFAVAKIDLQTENEPYDKLISINHYYHEVYDIPMPTGHVRTELYEISPDSRRIVFSSQVKKDDQVLYILSAYNTHEKRIEPIYSTPLDPNGDAYNGPIDLEFLNNSQIVFYNTMDSNVHLINLDSKEALILQTPGHSQRWNTSRNGKHYSFLKGDETRLIYYGQLEIQNETRWGLVIVNDKNEHEPVDLGDTNPTIRENYLLDDTGEYLLYFDYENASFGVNLYSAPLTGLKKK